MDYSKKHNYEIIKKIGGGNFGEVLLAYDNIKCELVTVKVIKRLPLKNDPYLRRLVQTEISVLYTAKHENIVGYKDYFETKEECHLAMEYCSDGDLYTYWINKNKRICENEAKEIIEQIVCGFKRLHELNVMHRDIKLENIFMKDKKIKIGDLGLAKIVPKTTFSKLGKIRTF